MADGASISADSREASSLAVDIESYVNRCSSSFVFRNTREYPSILRSENSNHRISKVKSSEAVRVYL